MNGLIAIRWWDSQPRWATGMSLFVGAFVMTAWTAALYRGLTYREPMSEH